MTSWREAVGTAAIGASLLLGGCTYETQPLSTEPGRLTVNVPGRFPAVVSEGAGAPPREAAIPAAAGPVTPRQGSYRGAASVRSNPGGQCRAMTISNWTVRGDQVRFGAFRGTIQPDGSLNMQAGQSYIRGRFSARGFTGTFWRPGPHCTFTLALRAYP